MALESLKAEFKISNIKNFDYSEFRVHKQIGNGEFSIVYLVDFKGETYTLKSINNNLPLDNNKPKKISRKLKALYMIEHPNVIKFYGISEHPTMGNFIMVLQFANNGSLRDYLQSKQQEGVFKNSWSETIQIAKEIILGLKHLHEKGIIHENLHSKNILMNDGKPLIADFGSSNDMVAYVDPQYFIHYGKEIERNERSDIYSLGVLLWELTSGTPPFSGLTNDYTIAIRISRGDREEMIPGTLQGYADIYKNCWSSEPEKRPKLNDILSDFDRLSTEISVEFIINNRI